MSLLEVLKMSDTNKLKQPKFTLEFKQDAARLVIDKGYSHQHRPLPRWGSHRAPLAIGSGPSETPGPSQATGEKQGQTQQKFEEKPGMHPSEQHIVSAIVEVRDAAFFRAKVPDRRGQVDRLDTLPAQAHQGFRIEIETPHPPLPAH